MTRHIRGLESDHDCPNQGQWIEVVLAAAQAPVQAGGVAAAEVPGVERADGDASVDKIARAQRACHRLIGGAQAAGMVDGDHAAARDLARERDGPRTGREHGLARDTGEVDAAMSPAIFKRRRLETTGHRWPVR